MQECSVREGQSLDQWVASRHATNLATAPSLIWVRNKCLPMLPKADACLLWVIKSLINQSPVTERANTHL